MTQEQLALRVQSSPRVSSSVVPLHHKAWALRTHTRFPRILEYLDTDLFAMDFAPALKKKDISGTDVTGLVTCASGVQDIVTDRMSPDLHEQCVSLALNTTGPSWSTF